MGVVPAGHFVDDNTDCGNKMRRKQLYWKAIPNLNKGCSSGHDERGINRRPLRIIRHRSGFAPQPLTENKREFRRVRSQSDLNRNPRTLT